MNRLSPVFDTSKPGYFTSIAGITNAKYIQFTEASQLLYQKILAIFEKHGLGYYLFAGSTLGYVRNKRMPPWMDDLDVILLQEEAQLFMERVVPELRDAGFICFEPGPYKGGGMHILALRETEHKDADVRFSKDLTLRVPRAQVDVFFTTVDDNGFLRNPANWGLYHVKNVPVSWVKPGRYIDVMGTRARVFSDYEKDILHEYGQVQDHLIIASHGKEFLTVSGVPWAEIEAEYNEIERRAKAARLPGLTASAPEQAPPQKSCTLIAQPQDDFVSLLHRVTAEAATDLVLSQPEHFFWALDLKRCFPQLRLHAELRPGAETSQDQARIEVSRVAHMSQAYATVSTQSQALQDLVEKQISTLDFALRPEINRGQFL